jgi:signal transduction histidine kinase
MRNGVSTVMDILDAANLKNGTVKYRRAEFDLARVVRDVYNDLMIVANSKKLELSYNPPNEAILFRGDQEKIGHHVVRNLIDNAIRYTPSGVITVTLETQDDYIRFVVEDTGIGVTKSDMSILFTEGGKGRDSTKVNVESTGYGLFVAKEVVEAHDGKIWVESEGKGKGSRFIVELPVKKA